MEDAVTGRWFTATNHLGRCWKFAFIIGAILCAQVSFAAVYKWTDANGKVHFSDKPPAETQAGVKEVRPRDPGPSGVRRAAPSVTRLLPKRAGPDARTVALVKVIASAKTGAYGEIGRVWQGRGCNRGYVRITRRGGEGVPIAEFAQQFSEVMKGYGYSAIVPKPTRGSPAARWQLSANITKQIVQG